MSAPYRRDAKPRARWPAHLEHLPLPDVRDLTDAEAAEYFAALLATERAQAADFAATLPMELAP